VFSQTWLYAASAMIANEVKQRQQLLAEGDGDAAKAYFPHISKFNYGFYI